MKRRSGRRIPAAGLLSCVLLCSGGGMRMRAQEEQSPTAVLLGRARTLEGRGRLDLAKQDWAQVLLADPNNAEALAGMARAAKVDGHSADAARYMNRLAAANPKESRLAAGEMGGQSTDSQARLKEAARLAHAGDFRGAMAMYRQLYGLNPPPGDEAVAYYETEAETEGGRPHAIAGLRALADRFPGDSRYPVALGTVLLESPRTRAEGLTLLELYPGNAKAMAALRRAETGEKGDAGAFQVKTTPVQAAPAAVPSVPVRPPDQTVMAEQAVRQSSHAVPRMQGVAHVEGRSSGAEEQLAYAALNGRRLSEAEQRFEAILAQAPNESRALAGMGYVRFTQGNFAAALALFERAQENGDHSLALLRALTEAQVNFLLQHGNAARQTRDLRGAERDFREALQIRPDDSGGLMGLGSTLLDAQRDEAAISVFGRLVQIRPMDPAGWRGLVMAEVGAGRYADALGTMGRAPADVKRTLAQDAVYQQTATSVYRASGRDPEAQKTLGTAQVQPPVVATAGEPPRVQPGVAATANAAVKPQPTISANVGHVNADRAAVGPTGKPPALAVTLPLAEAAMASGESTRAVVLYKEVLAVDPASAEAWKGLVSALHAAGRDQDAVTQVGLIPVSARASLERDPGFLAGVGGAYLKLRQPRQALVAYAHAQEFYAEQKTQPPLDVELQLVELLFDAGDDANLYLELMYLGGRKDLSDAQRQRLQVVWGDWAVRRSKELSVAGNQARAAVLLHAAGEAFGENADVMRVVASGYVSEGMAGLAVAMYKARDLTTAPAGDVKAGMAAGLAARDWKAARNWAKLGTERFPSDAEMFFLAGEIEEAKGDRKRAAEYFQRAQSLSITPNAGAVLAMEMRAAGLREPQQSSGSLATMLMPASASPAAHPYLPSYHDDAKQPSPAKPDEPPLLTGYGGSGCSPFCGE